VSNVLLIGNGAREHAMAAALVRGGAKIQAHMDKINPGIARLATETTIGNLLDPEKLPDTSGIDYAVIGPEAPLSRGVSDFLEKHGVACASPLQSQARIETSKAFARRLLQEFVPRANPRYVAAKSLDALRKFASEIGYENIVVKPDGLTGGKGVRVFGDHLHSRTEVEAYASHLLSDNGIVVLEEKLVGTEFTLQTFSDGKHLELMPLVRDYKRAFDGDTGPNTGSMGSYSEAGHGLSYITQGDVKEAKLIMEETLRAIKRKTHTDYRGVLYGQFMKTSAGLKVVEYNARFGDPEAMNVLSLLRTSFDTVCQGIIDGNLSPPEFEKQATVCVYVVPNGYPGVDVVKDTPFSIEPGTESEIYYASVYEKNQIFYTTSSRTLGIIGKGDTVADARKRAYSDAGRVNGKLRYRTDIAAGI
jgi:phosphoribosylamine--glycine ligase